MDWQEEPATNQQLLRLQGYGFVPTCPLSVTEAARLIRQYSKHPSHPAPLPKPANSAPVTASALAVQEAIGHGPRPTGPVPESSKTHVCQLRTAVAAAQQVAAANPNRPGVKADVQSAIAARQQFWMDTCRDPRQLQAVSEYALDFYRRYGMHFFPPTWDQIRQVLDVLDAALPAWDKDHPELFYDTLKLNFPSLLRQK